MSDCMQTDYFGTAERYLLGSWHLTQQGWEKKKSEKKEEGEEREEQKRKGRRERKEKKEKGRRTRKKKEKEENINKQGQKHKVPAFQHGRHHRLEVACSGACQGTNTVPPCCWGLAVTRAPGEDA